ncbi:MAG: hypothetical protein EBS12_05705, partial [Flavobacteriia bacterium]|nr:hypothetical protein [Flavobacteriia bacterium]
MLTQWSETYGAPLFIAAVAAENIAAKFAREVNVSADGVSVSIGELQQRFNDLAVSLRDQYKAKYGNFDPTTALNMFSDQWDPSIPSLVFGVGFN